MFTFSLTNQFLSEEEQKFFLEHIQSLGLGENIWEVFSSLFRSGTKHTKPCLLRAFRDSELVGAAILIKCQQYGKALFDHKSLSSAIDALKIPYYLWVKFGCCMDMLSNPGFVKYPAEYDSVVKAMLGYLKKNTLLTILNDFHSNGIIHEKAAILPALPHAAIDCNSMNSIDDYLSNYKNITKKVKVFHKKGGEYHLVHKSLAQEQIDSVRKCFISTSENSVFYLPYQDLYLKSALETSASPIPGVHYFIATLDGEFLGYQAALWSGDHLNALHGAFDRDRKTTYHAYDILFVKMTEFAIENGIKDIDFGAVLNYTKQKMVNRTREMNYYIYSKYGIVQRIMGRLLKSTKVQGSEQMKFRSYDQEPDERIVH